MSLLNKKWLIIFAVILLAVGYWQYSSRAQKQGVTNGAVVPVAPIINSEDNKIIETLAELKSLAIDVKFFDNEFFKGLVDFSRELTPEPKGRPNPFLPLK